LKNISEAELFSHRINQLSLTDHEQHFLMFVKSVKKIAKDYQQNFIRFAFQSLLKDNPIGSPPEHYM